MSVLLTRTDKRIWLLRSLDVDTEEIVTIDELITIAAANGLAITEPQRNALDRFVALLCKANVNVNLISRKDEENVLSKHILHSLSLVMPSVCGYTFAEGATVFDIGTGGGLPGIPMKIVRDDLELLLCDSIRKKIGAVTEIIATMGFTRIAAVCERAEVLAINPKYGRQYDVIVSRAVAPLDEMVRWTSGLLRRGGTVLALKGGDLDDELRRTRSLRFVAEVVESPLALVGYDGFRTEEKKMVRVTLHP